MSDEPSKDSPGQPAEASETYDVFISHASADKDIARLLARRLTDAGLNVWFDEFKLAAGERWPERIRQAIGHSRLCVILLSNQALPSKSWLSDEWSAIQECSWRRSDLSLCPVKLDDVETPPFLRSWQSLRLDKHAEDRAAFDRTLKNIVLLVSDWGAAHRTGPSDADQLLALT